MIKVNAIKRLDAMAPEEMVRGAAGASKHAAHCLQMRLMGDGLGEVLSGAILRDWAGDDYRNRKAATHFSAEEIRILQIAHHRLALAIYELLPQRREQLYQAILASDLESASELLAG